MIKTAPQFVADVQKRDDIRIQFINHNVKNYEQLMKFAYQKGYQFTLPELHEAVQTLAEEHPLRRFVEVELKRGR